MPSPARLLLWLLLLCSTAVVYAAQDSLPSVTRSRLTGHTPAETAHTPDPRSLRPSPLAGKHDVCIAITGGAGQIAYALIPLILHGRVFGEGRKVRLRLLDIEACAGALAGVAMEIQDCYSDLVTEVVTTSDPEVAFEGADVAVLLGGFPRLPGMDRRDLIARNVPIMVEHGKALAKCAKEEVRVLVVANPACTNCLIASMSASSIPRCQFSSLARLDQDRLSAMLSDELRSLAVESVSEQASMSAAQHNRKRNPTKDRDTAIVPRDHTEVRGVYVWGNHSPSMWPDVSAAEVKIDGGWVPFERTFQKQGEISSEAGKVSAPDLDGVTSDADLHLRAEGWYKRTSTTIITAVRERGTKVIEARGKSSALSASNAIASHLKDWLSCSTVGENRVSMGVQTDGNPYGVPGDLFFSFPVECGDGHHRILAGCCPDKAMLRASARELVGERQEALDTLQEAGLYPKQ
ncbi:unnamed protein product [Scytosiphon promiscuus]